MKQKIKITLSRMKLLSIFIIAFSFMNIGCAAKKIQRKQGIQGVVYQVTGNQMPGIKNSKAYPDNTENNRGEAPGFKTRLYIFETTNVNQVVQQKDSPFYSEIKSKLILETVSATDGSFKVDLPVGSYSIFAKIGTLYYANRFDEHNNIFLVEVKADTYTTVDFKVDYNAVY